MKTQTGRAVAELVAVEARREDDAPLPNRQVASVSLADFHDIRRRGRRVKPCVQVPRELL